MLRETGPQRLRHRVGLVVDAADRHAHAHLDAVPRVFETRLELVADRIEVLAVHETLPRIQFVRGSRGGLHGLSHVL